MSLKGPGFLRPRSPVLILLLDLLRCDFDHNCIMNIDACREAALKRPQNSFSMQVSYICFHVSRVAQLLPGDSDIADWVLCSDTVSIE